MAEARAPSKKEGRLDTMATFTIDFEVDDDKRSFFRNDVLVLRYKAPFAGRASYISVFSLCGIVFGFLVRNVGKHGPAGDYNLYNVSDCNVADVLALVADTDPDNTSELVRDCKHAMYSATRVLCAMRRAADVDPVRFRHPIRSFSYTAQMSIAEQARALTFMRSKPTVALATFDGVPVLYAASCTARAARSPLVGIYPLLAQLSDVRAIADVFGKFAAEMQREHTVTKERLVHVDRAIRKRYTPATHRSVYGGMFAPAYRVPTRVVSAYDDAVAEDEITDGGAVSDDDYTPPHDVCEDASPPSDANDIYLEDPGDSTASDEDDSSENTDYYLREAFFNEMIYV